MLTRNHSVEILNDKIKQVWITPDSQWQIQLSIDHTLRIEWMLEDQCGFRELPLPVELRNLTDFHYNSSSTCAAWIADNQVIFISNLSAPTIRIFDFESTIISHQITSDGKFIIAQAIAVRNRSTLFVVDITHGIQRQLTDVNSYSIFKDELYVIKYKSLFCHRNFRHLEFCNVIYYFALQLPLAYKFYLSRNKLAYVCQDSNNCQDCIQLYKFPIDDFSGLIHYQTLRDFKGQIKSLYFSDNGNKVVCLTQHVFSVDVTRKREYIYVFTLNDARQTYCLPLPATGATLVPIADDNKVVATLNNQIFTWSLTPRMSPEDRLSYHLVNNAGQTLVLNGLELLKLASEVVHEILEPLTQSSVHTEMPHRVGSGKSWLLLADRHITEGKILVGATDQTTTTPVTVHAGKVTFPGMSNDYPNIAAQLKNLREKYLLPFSNHLTINTENTSALEIQAQRIKHSHISLAHILLQRIQLLPYPAYMEATDQQFLDRLLVLMISASASLVDTTYLTTLLLLDLIANHQSFGRLERPYSFDNIFTSGAGYQNNGQQQHYGGKFPLALASNDGSYLENRNTLLSMIPTENGLKSIIETSYQNLVPKKEVSLIIHWLNNLRRRQLDVLKTAINNEQAKAIIKDFLTQRVKLAYDIDPILREQTEHLSQFIAFNNRESNNMSSELNMQAHQQRVQYYIEFNAESHSAEKHYYHRTDVACTMIAKSGVNHTKDARLQLTLRQLVGIKKTLNTTFFDYYTADISEHTKMLEITDGIITFHNPRGLVALAAPMVFNTTQSRLIKNLCIEFLTLYELNFYTPHPIEADISSEIFWETIQHIRFEIPQAASALNKTAHITLATIKQAIIKNTSSESPKRTKTDSPTASASLSPGKIVIDRQALHEMSKSCLSYISQQLNSPNGDKKPLDNAHIKLSYYDAQLKGTTIVTTLNVDLFEKLKSLAKTKYRSLLLDPTITTTLKSYARVTASSLKREDYLLELIYWLCSIVPYDIEKMFFCSDNKSQELAPCPKCYSTSNVNYPGIPYNYPHAVCLIHEKDEYYHRVFLNIHSLPICSSIGYDYPHNEFYGRRSPAHERRSDEERLPLALQFIAQASASGKRPCPQCWWLF